MAESVANAAARLGQKISEADPTSTSLVTILYETNVLTTTRAQLEVGFTNALATDAPSHTITVTLLAIIVGGPTSYMVSAKRNAKPRIVLGVTGTREGLNATQVDYLIKYLKANKSEITHLHHGDCVGADADVHKLVRHHVPDAKIVVHPPDYDNNRAFCNGDETKKVLPYIVRNKKIVKASTMMLAFPVGRMELQRSGTWATIRYTKQKTTVPITIVWQHDNKVTHYNKRV